MHEEFFLAFIVSIDTYLAAAAYRNSGIKIPASSAFIINLICSAVLGISLCFSGFISRFVSPESCRRLGCAVIFAIGLLTIFKSIARTIAGRISENGEISLKLGGSSLAVKIYLDDTAADIDHSKILSAGESAALALASSLDSAAMGLSSGFADISPLLASVLTFFCGCTAVALGVLTGKKISALNHDFSWIGGVLLILFAIFG